MTWEEMVRKHPNRWLALHNCVYDKTNDATLIEADIAEVFLTSEEYGVFRDNHIGNGYRYEYTGESPKGWTDYILSKQSKIKETKVKEMDKLDFEIENGLFIYSRPHKVDLLQFAYEHLDCDIIVVEHEEAVIAFATKQEYNIALYELFERKYKEHGYLYMNCIDSSTLNMIWGI